MVTRKMKKLDVIRQNFRIDSIYLNHSSPIAITNKLRRVKHDAKCLAIKLGWDNWELTEMYSPDHRLYDIPTPYVGPTSWRECIQRFGHCIYSVVLYKK